MDILVSKVEVNLKMVSSKKKTKVELKKLEMLCKKKLKELSKAKVYQISFSEDDIYKQVLSSPINIIRYTDEGLYIEGLDQSVYFNTGNTDFDDLDLEKVYCYCEGDIILISSFNKDNLVKYITNLKNFINKIGGSNGENKF
ncbi:MAG: hypothetical protein ACRC23_01495 [Aeromonas jandaei]